MDVEMVTISGPVKVVNKISGGDHVQLTDLYNRQVFRKVTKAPSFGVFALALVGTARLYTV